MTRAVENKKGNARLRMTVAKSRVQVGPRDSNLKE